MNCGLRNTNPGFPGWLRAVSTMGYRLAGGRTDMLAVLHDLHDAIIDLCQQFGVLTLSVFGSAASGEFVTATSDIDFIVELDPPAGMTRFEAFFGLKEALEEALARRVDLVDPSALENPYFAKSVESSRRELYAG